MVYLVIGRRTKGKTTLGYYQIRKMPKRAIFDPRGMVLVGPRAVRVANTRQLRDEMPALFENEIDELIFTPAQDDIDPPFLAFCREIKTWITDHPGERLGVLIDELGFLELPTRDAKVVRWIMRSCDKETVHFFVTCHRPVDVPVSMRSIADFWYVFHCVQEHDLDVIRKRMKHVAADDVARLQGREFLHWDDAESTYTIRRDAINPSTGRNGWYIEMRHASQAIAGLGLDEIPGSSAKNRVDASKLPL